VARHRLPARRPTRSRHSGSHELVRDPREVAPGRVSPPAQPVRAKIDSSDQPDLGSAGGPLEIPLDRAPVGLRATIQQYWADGLDAPDIAERLSGYGVTVHDVLVERYLHSG